MGRIKARSLVGTFREGFVANLGTIPDFEKGKKNQT
jgi:hypothetical protein